MKAKDSKHLSDKDSALVERVVQTLDESADVLDELTLMRLKNVRQHALVLPVQKKSKWMPISTAASVAVLLIAPLMWHQYTEKYTSNSAATSAVAAQEFPAGIQEFDTQELDDMDMLMAMGDIDA